MPEKGADEMAKKGQENEITKKPGSEDEQEFQDKALSQEGEKSSDGPAEETDEGTTSTETDQEKTTGAPDGQAAAESEAIGPPVSVPEQDPDEEADAPKPAGPEEISAPSKPEMVRGEDVLKIMRERGVKI